MGDPTNLNVPSQDTYYIFEQLKRFRDKVVLPNTAKINIGKGNPHSMTSFLSSKRYWNSLNLKRWWNNMTFEMAILR